MPRFYLAFNLGPDKSEKEVLLDQNQYEQIADILDLNPTHCRVAISAYGEERTARCFRSTCEHPMQGSSEEKQRRTRSSSSRIKA